jgi:UPF0755 protein
MSRKFQKRTLFAQKRQSGLLRKSWIGALLLLVALYGFIFLWAVVPGASNTNEPNTYKVKINAQSSLASIGDQLSQQGIAVNAFTLHIAARALFVGSKLKPGTYLVPLRGSLGNLLLQLARGDRIRESIAIIPGMTIWQLQVLIDRHPALIHQTKGLSSKELLKSLNLPYQGAEGLFFPDTYIFDPDETDAAIYRRASQAMQKQLSQAWQQKGSRSPLKSPYELLTLASIIEKETGKASDRQMVAAVFINRLNKGMLLQTDPTVIYGLGANFDGNLRKSDLRKDNPYNTYMHKGLPPTPIAMPSHESLMAAAQPANSDALYFVARGDGTSHFSTSLIEHETAVDRFQRKAFGKSGAKQ